MPRINEVPSYATIIEFQKVYVRVIALAWRDPEFKQALTDDARQALADYFGYILPWNIDLEIFTDDTNPQPDGKRATWSPENNSWENVPNNSVTFGVPRPPQDKESHSIALAAYSDAGPAYLFTCC